MAKFKGKELFLADGQRIIFGTDFDSHIWWDDVAQELRLDTTISGVDPVQDYQLTTKWYVDDEIDTLSGTIPYEHDQLIGLEDDDHLQYVPRTGVRGFTATVSGVTPTEPYHLTTKQYVDSQVSVLDWQDSVLDIINDPPGGPSIGDRYLISATASGTWAGEEDNIAEWNGTSWDIIESNEGFATWVEDEDVVYVFNGTDWVRLGTIVDHGNLTGLDDDDHLQYVPTNADRGFTATVSGIDPTLDYHLATKWYVDQGSISKKGRQAIANGASFVSVSFADIGHTNYTVNATMANTTDSPPSIYAYIVSATTTSGFDVTFMGDMDSANYVLHWSLLED